MNEKTFNSKIANLFKPEIPDWNDEESYRQAWDQFGENWQSAREVLGECWRYAESLFVAGMLLQKRTPLFSNGIAAGERIQYARKLSK